MRRKRCLRGVRTPHSQARAIALADACWVAIHDVVSLKLTGPSFPTAAPETLSRRLLNSLSNGKHNARLPAADLPVRWQHE